MSDALIVALVNEIQSLEKRLAALETMEYEQATWLTTPLTSTSWDGDARSTTAATLLDLSAVFGAPAGIKAAYVHLVARDSGASLQSALFLILGPSVTNLGNNGTYSLGVRPLGDDLNVCGSGWVPCDANGDFAYRIAASGAGTMDVVMEIWGYAL